ncbi:MAG: hypothetical protein GY739_20640 [Mesoflavibacter sp.]|nr:hypothetical protein [Mesoflavibacter sp.]
MLKKAMEEAMTPGHDKIYRIAKRYNIPYETLRGNIVKHSGLYGGSGRKQGGQTKLPYIEEMDICTALVYMAEAGAPPNRAMLQQIVRTYLNYLGRDDVFPNNNTPGKDWVSTFIVYFIPNLTPLIETTLPVYTIYLSIYLSIYLFTSNAVLSSNCYKYKSNFFSASTLAKDTKSF